MRSTSYNNKNDNESIESVLLHQVPTKERVKNGESKRYGDSHVPVQAGWFEHAVLLPRRATCSRQFHVEISSANIITRLGDFFYSWDIMRTKSHVKRKSCVLFIG